MVTHPGSVRNRNKVLCTKMLVPPFGHMVRLQARPALAIGEAMSWEWQRHGHFWDEQLMSI